MNSPHTIAQLESGLLRGISRLDLSAGLTEFPRAVFNLADSLEVLNLTGNRLSTLPDDLPRLRRLRIIFCSENQFTHLPEVLGQCPNLTMIGFKANQIRELPRHSFPKHLRWLVLTDNQISQIPAKLGRCTRLQKLMLSGNQLQSLPEELADCSALELLRVASNRLAELPSWLLQLPRLAWLAFSGNPVQRSGVPTTPNVRAIPWEHLKVGDRLGEGASGIILSARWGEKPVAIKLFKGAMTSDGLPEHELAACLTAGVHPHLIPLLGTLENHPEGASGLVMDLLPQSCSILAQPPSLDSCTRDIYAQSARFSPAEVSQMATKVASVCAHLHSNGVMHGDLYAHNLSRNANGDCYLGDFGAASIFCNLDPVQAAGLQRLDVLAFGHLLGELLDRTDGTDSAALRELETRCVSRDPFQRPTFDTIVRHLDCAR
ncbi:MAG: leucine-rich repeat-containing protein kinase family protein [Verrucomicrobiota bacterium]